MIIDKNTVVTLHYELRDMDGNILDEGGNLLSYLHGGYGGIFPLVEAGLSGKQVGEEFSISLEPDDAFGEYDENLIRIEPLNRFPANIKVGMQFEGAPEGADQEDYIVYTITDIEKDQVIVDGNHPLAGERLFFKCTVADIRPATKDETMHGHAHGDHGHVH